MRAAYDGDLYRFAIDYVAGDGNDIVLTSQGAVGLVGDYNGDGTVDAADYTVWRDSSARSAPAWRPTATARRDRRRRLRLWKAHFGESAGSGSLAVRATVPEPAAACCSWGGGPRGAGGAVDGAGQGVFRIDAAQRESGFAVVWRRPLKDYASPPSSPSTSGTKPKLPSRS